MLDFMTNVTAAHRAHFSAIAEASAAIELERQTSAAHEAPAAKIEEALRLSNALLRTVTKPSEPDATTFSLIKRWREIQARRSK